VGDRQELEEALRRLVEALERASYELNHLLDGLGRERCLLLLGNEYIPSHDPPGLLSDALPRVVNALKTLEGCGFEEALLRLEGHYVAAVRAGCGWALVCDANPYLAFEDAMRAARTLVIVDLALGEA